MCILIGDCHGRITPYENIIKYLDDGDDIIHSILLGELGFKKEHDWFADSPYSKNNKILFGNHEHWPYLAAPYSLGRYRWFPQEKMFSIAGGFSIDKQYRREGLTWFEEEEMDSSQEAKCLKEYENRKPEIVISHEGPDSIVDSFFLYTYKYPGGSRTLKFFELLLRRHRPKVWVFAHHHKSKDETINGTRFICLDELETIDLDKL